MNEQGEEAKGVMGPDRMEGRGKGHRRNRRSSEGFSRGVTPGSVLRLWRTQGGGASREAESPGHSSVWLGLLGGRVGLVTVGSLAEWSTVKFECRVFGLSNWKDGVAVDVLYKDFGFWFEARATENSVVEEKHLVAMQSFVNLDCKSLGKVTDVCPRAILTSGGRGSLLVLREPWEEIHIGVNKVRKKEG